MTTRHQKTCNDTAIRTGNSLAASWYQQRSTIAEHSEYLTKSVWQDGIDRGWFRTNRSAIHGLPDLLPILATAREVASGMAHLHSINILHGDLTSLNVLLASSDIDNRGFVAKVSFGGRFLLLLSMIACSRLSCSW